MTTQLSPGSSRKVWVLGRYFYGFTNIKSSSFRPDFKYLSVTEHLWNILKKTSQTEGAFTWQLCCLHLFATGHRQKACGVSIPQQAKADFMTKGVL